MDNYEWLVPREQVHRAPRQVAVQRSQHAQESTVEHATPQQLAQQITEHVQQQTEHALRESELSVRFRGLYKRVYDGIVAIPSEVDRFQTWLRLRQERASDDVAYFQERFGFMYFNIRQPTLQHWKVFPLFWNDNLQHTDLPLHTPTRLMHQSLNLVC